MSLIMHRIPSGRGVTPESDLTDLDSLSCDSWPGKLVLLYPLPPAEVPRPFPRGCLPSGPRASS